MSRLDSMMGEDLVQMYENHIFLPDGTERVRYAYGLPWVSMALYMDDISFETPKEAIDYWNKNFAI